MKTGIKFLFLILFVTFVLQSGFGQQIQKAKLIQSADLITSDLGSLYIDVLRNELEDMPDSIGYIIIYGGRISKVGEIEAHIRGIRQAIDDKRFDKSKFIFIQGGFREKLTVDFLVVPKDTCPPLPTPTVQIEKVRFKGVSRKIIPYFCC